MELILRAERLREARILRGLSQYELATNLGVTKQAISQYENGIIVPKADVLSQIISELDMPISYFSKPDDIKILTPIFFRKGKTAKKKNTDIFEIFIKWTIEIYAYLEKILKFPQVNLIRGNKNRYSFEEINEYSIKLRRLWGLGNGPINNLNLLLENNGFIIAKTPLPAERVDACSVYFTSSDIENRPMIFLTSNTSAVRFRRDLLHETAHQVLHSWMSKEDFEENKETIEREAEIFASCFLMPSESMAKERFVVDSLEGLLHLKRRWGASAQAILYHLKLLELIDDRLFERLRSNMYARGWRKKEPYDEEIKQEFPELLKDALMALVDNNIKSPKEILEDFSLPPDDILKLCNLQEEFFDGLNQKKYSLRFVK